MADHHLEKQESRRLYGELRQLMNEWNPIGADGLPAGEYDCLTGPVLTQLLSGVDSPQLAVFLRTQLHDHFGLEPEPSNPEQFATRLTLWWKKQNSL